MLFEVLPNIGCSVLFRTSHQFTVCCFRFHETHQRAIDILDEKRCCFGA